MLLRDVFGPLLRAVTGGRFPEVADKRRRPPPSFGAPWDDLPPQLGLPAHAFQDIVLRGDLHPHFHYRPFTRPKKDGGERHLVEPDVKLKRVQQAILRRYLTREQPHPAAVAYRKGLSIADHVWPHAGAETIIAADVEDFFPSTRAGRVEDWWAARVEDECAELLAVLTTYEGGLPQGAPTSPALSNLVNFEMDVRLANRAEAAGAVYTRYCDDVVFSWRHGLGPPSDFEVGVRAILHEHGYALHPRKGWRVYHLRDEPEITGVILARNGGVRLPDGLRRTMRKLARSKDARDLQRLEGYRGFEAMVLDP